MNEHHPHVGGPCSTEPSLHDALAAAQAFISKLAAQPRWRRAFAIRIVLHTLGYEAAADRVRDGTLLDMADLGIMPSDVGRKHP